MPDEIMKIFLEQMIECCGAFSEALAFALQYYQIAVAEKEFYSDSLPEMISNYGGDLNGKEK